MCILRKNPTSQTVSPHCKYQQQNFLLTARAENKYISPFNLEHGCKACVKQFIVPQKKSFHTRKYFNSIHFSFAYLYLQINYITFCVETPCITNWTNSLFNQYHLHVDDTRPVNLNPLFQICKNGLVCDPQKNEVQNMGCKQQGAKSWVRTFFCYSEREDLAWPLLFYIANCKQKKYDPESEKNQG